MTNNDRINIIYCSSNSNNYSHSTHRREVAEEGENKTKTQCQQKCIYKQKIPNDKTKKQYVKIEISTIKM